MKKNNQIDQKEKFTIELKDRIVILELLPFDTDVDMDEFTTIHYHNIMGEILTCSTAMNRIGNLLANYDEILAETKLDFDIFEAQMKEEKRKSLEFEDVDSKGVKKYKKPSQDEVEVAVIRDPRYKVKKKNLIEKQKNRDIINSFYWAVKSKDEKLNRITEKLRPEDFAGEILEEKINGVLLKVRNKAIK